MLIKIRGDNSDNSILDSILIGYGSLVWVLLYDISYDYSLFVSLSLSMWFYLSLVCWKICFLGFSLFFCFLRFFEFLTVFATL